MRRYTLIHEKAMDFVLIEDAQVERFEEFFRAAYPDSGMASFQLGDVCPEIERTDEDDQRVVVLMDEFKVWKKGDFCR